MDEGLMLINCQGDNKTEKYNMTNNSGFYYHRVKQSFLLQTIYGSNSLIKKSIPTTVQDIEKYFRKESLLKVFQSNSKMLPPAASLM